MYLVIALAIACKTDKPGPTPAPAPAIPTTGVPSGTTDQGPSKPDTAPTPPPASSANSVPMPKPGANRIDPAAARDLIDKGAVVLDVRTTEEYAEDHLPSSVNIPVQDFAARIAEVEKLTGGDKTKPIVVHCGSGARAAKAKAQLDAAGYTTVVNGGGLDDLQ